MEKSIRTDNMTPEQALIHLKSVVATAQRDALSIGKKYSSTLLVCFRWENDDVWGSKDCDDISNVFKEKYGAEVMTLVLEMKQYIPFDVMRLVLPILQKLNKAQLVVLFYRYVALF